MISNLEELKEQIRNRSINLSVVGLGYVGLNISCLFAKNGFKVFGFDVDKNKVEKLQSNINPIPEESWLNPHISKIFASTYVQQAPLKGDIIFLALPTPCINNKTNLEYLKSGLKNLGTNIKGKILIFESTVPPGTTQKLVKELLELRTGLTAGKDFWFAYSPERIDPSSSCHFIWNTPKIVGGVDSFSTDIVSYLYSQVIENVVSVSNPVTAEFVKVVENTQRNVNIALVNLLALVADQLKIDVSEALSAAATKWNFVNVYPGCGVGGECIDDSAKMLAEAMDELNVRATFVKESCRINSLMPLFTVDKAKKLCKELNKPFEEVRIGVLGLAYKGNSSDIRNSPGLKVIDNLKKAGFLHIVAYDSLVSQEVSFNFQRVNTLEEVFAKTDLLILTTDHDEFKKINATRLNKSVLKIIVDGRNCLDKDLITSAGIVYRGIGR